MIDLKQFRDIVVVPTLHRIGLHSKAAVTLMLCTALAESKLYWIKQQGKGPALGVYQIEPFTLHDIYKTYLDYKPRERLRDSVNALAGYQPGEATDPKVLERQVTVDLAYATGIARIKYRRKKPPIPAHDNLEAMAHYWKKHYNTHLGAGTVTKFLKEVEPHKEVLCE